MTTSSPSPPPSQIAAADFRKNASGCVVDRPGQSVSHAILYLRRISAAQQPTSFFSTLSLQFLKLVRPRWSQVSQTRWAGEWGDRLCPVKITPWQNITTIHKSTSRLIHLSKSNRQWNTAKNTSQHLTSCCEDNVAEKNILSTACSANNRES